MKLFQIIIALCFISINALCQSKIDTVLQKKIIAMFNEDQKWRIEAQNLCEGKKSVYDEATVNHNMAKTDSLNMLKAKLIVARYGFPGYDIVGQGYSNDFWAIIQHCDDDIKFQQQVLLVLSKQVTLHNASGENYALLEDRVLIGTGRKQFFGTQVLYNPLTKNARPLPIQDSTNVDKRRKEVGMMTLNEYLKMFDRN